MYKVNGKWSPNPSYVGNSIQFGPYTVDEQIESLRAAYALESEIIERDYEQRKGQLEERFQRKMQILLGQK